MLERLKDLKTTIPGLLLGLALMASALYTMKIRPDWGIPEILALVGGLGTMGLGALASSAKPVPDVPPPPKVPSPPVLPAVFVPAMAFLAFLVVTGAAVTGCARPLDTAITAANGARDVGQVAHDTIESECLPAYRGAGTPAAVAAADARCLVPMKAYRVYRAAWAVSVVSIQRAQLGLATPAAALAAAVDVGRAGADLAASLQAVSK